MGFVALNSGRTQDLPPGRKIFYSVGIDVRLTKKWSLRVSEFFGYQLYGAYPLQLLIPSLTAQYRWNKRWRTSFGYRPLYFRGREKMIWYSRWQARISYYKRSKPYLWRYSLIAEHFKPTTKKYQYRIILSARFYDRQRLPWKGKPYIEGRLYYYYGGKPLKYYHKDGTLVTIKAPNDFHRYRIIIGARFKPYRNLRLSTYYIYQREFNNPFTNHRDINVPSRYGTKIRYPFNNYTVFGISLTIKMDYRKVKKSKRSKGIKS